MDTAPSILEIGLLLLGVAALGWTARRIGLPAVVGYLALGLAVSPFTPGFVADRGQLQLLGRPRPGAGRPDRALGRRVPVGEAGAASAGQAGTAGVGHAGAAREGWGPAPQPAVESSRGRR